MTQRSIQEIEAWALQAVEISKKQMTGMTSSDHAIATGHYEIAMDLCTFLGIEDRIKE